MALTCIKPGLKPISQRMTNVTADQPSWGQGRGGRPWRRLREQIFTRDKYLCQICLKAGKLTAVELHGPNAGICDHIIPKAEGGQDAETNLQTICKGCDIIKTGKESNGAKTYGHTRN